ncbi:MAG: hypothetical protein KJ718_04235 [Nanoarchaeota archaeon]|nr:hypothetical protein [Nanoarchaeota archaeon]MBU1051737.1 hypothetical protein [Nanoarchaeota archaeon]
MKIIPTIFAHNKKEFTERFKKLLPVSKNLQIDFMDGKFVKAKSLQPSQIPDLKKYSNNFEAHLMISNPQLQIKKLKKKGFKKIIFHHNSTQNINSLIKKIKSLHMKVFLAINPNVAVNNVIPYLKQLDGILFLGVQPGKERQDFIHQIYEKIRFLRKKNKTIKIQVDGGATPEVIKRLAKLKVNYINSGSYIADSKNPKETYKRLNALVKK